VSQFKPLVDFKIDDGQLDGYGEALSFVLGVEFQKTLSFIDEIDVGDSVTCMIHTKNVDRVTKSLESMGCFSRTVLCTSNPAWTELFFVRRKHVDGS